MRTHISLERRDDVAVLTLECDTEGKPPTIDLAVLDELAGRIEGLQSMEEGLCALLVQSSSPRYFCVGADVRALESLDATTIVHWIERGHEVFDRLARLPLPVIACVQGYALGGGLELAMSCDLIVAATTARLGQPEAKLGFVAGWGGTFRLPERVGAARAKELFFTGRTVDAVEAHSIGLVDLLCEPGALDATVDGLVEQFRSCSVLALAEMKRLVDERRVADLQHSHLQEVVASCRCMADAGTQARIRAFLDRRAGSR